jgi:hypothetical protein
MMLQSFVLPKGKKVMLWDGEQAEAYMDNPAKVVQIDGLPENVVPITRGSKNIEYLLRSYESLNGNLRLVLLTRGFKQLSLT